MNNETVTASDNNSRGLKIAVAIYFVILAGKIVAYFVTGVLSLLAEALHTLSDIFVSSFLLIAAAWSRKKADETHMFGYGKAQNVGALVAATLFISFTSFELYKEAIPRLFKASETSYQNLSVALGVIIASMLAAAIPLFTILREKTRGAAAKAQLTELFNDELGLIAALIGTLFIIWGKPIADPIASLIVATIIAVNAIKLFRENGSFLLGRAPDQEFMEKIKNIAVSVPGVEAVNELRAEYVGPETIHVGLQVKVSKNMSVDEASNISTEIRKRVHKDIKHGYCFIEVKS